MPRVVQCLDDAVAQQVQGAGAGLDGVVAPVLQPAGGGADFGVAGSRGGRRGTASTAAGSRRTARRRRSLRGRTRRRPTRPARWSRAAAAGWSPLDEDGPQVVVGAVEQFLHHRLRRGAGRAGHAFRPGVELRRGRAGGSGRFPTGVRSGSCGPRRAGRLARWDGHGRSRAGRAARAATAFSGQPGRGIVVGQRGQGRAVGGPGAPQIGPDPVGGVAHGFPGREVEVFGGQSVRAWPATSLASRSAGSRPPTTRTPTKLVDAVSALTCRLQPAAGTRRRRGRRRPVRRSPSGRGPRRRPPDAPGGATRAAARRALRRVRRDAVAMSGRPSRARLMNWVACGAGTLPDGRACSSGATASGESQCGFAGDPSKASVATSSATSSRFPERDGSCRWKR